MDVLVLLDLAEQVRKEVKGRVDARFRFNRFVRDYENDDVFAALDYIRKEPPHSMCSIVISKELCDSLTRDQVIDYIEKSILEANSDLAEFIRDKP